MDDSQIVGKLSAGKRRRGRPQKNQAGITALSPKKNRKDEEDVCFICFDGGSLVLCDRRDCPKAYHPACIKRDEAFFKSKVKWKCGWHICRTCQKASYYMCYTCTYSLCKSCTKDADYVNVRGNKGFCGTCIRTIMLIENSTLGNQDMVQVDFDDKTSWEYLFKVYWVFLKEKLSLSLDELSKAKNPWKEIAAMGPNGELSGELCTCTNAKRGNRETPFRDLGARSSKRIKTMKQENVLDLVESLETERTGVTNGMPFPEGINWATKELLEFVAHRKNGDTSVISRFDVQALLLEYIAKGNLRDPCQKSYIICDSMLIKLFGKQRVGHFEMFKLLDSHFLTKDHSVPISIVRGGGTKAVATQLAVNGIGDGQPIIVDYKGCKNSIGIDGQPITVDSNSNGPVKGDDVLSDIGSKGFSIRPHSTGMDLSVNNIETDEKWRYQDPLGKIQGPFSMALLRKLSLSGLFPPDMRIWRASEKQDDSILLIDAFDGQFNKTQRLFQNSCVPTEGVRIASDDGCQNRDGDVMESRDLSAKQIENKEVEGSSKLMQNNTSGHNCGNDEYVKSKELGSQSSPCSASVDIVNSNAVQMGSHLPNWDSVKGDNHLPGQPQVSSSVPSSTVSLKPCETQSRHVSNGHGIERLECGSIDMNEDLNKTSEGQSIAENVNRENNDRKSGKSCEQSWRSSPLNDASNGWDLNSGVVSLEMTLEASKNNQDIDLSIFPTSTSKLNNEDSKRQAAKSKQSLSLNFPHQDSGPSFSPASSLVGTGSQLPEVVGEWGRYTSTPAKPSAEEWSSDLIHQSSLKPTHLGSNHSAPPTSGNGQLTHSSSTDPADNASGWEYSLAGESVSDLLAEVEAMESLNALPSPTSKLRSDGELAQGSEHNCFSPVGEPSPTHNPGKSDALSSRNNLQVPSHSTVTNDLFGVSQAEVLDAHKSSGRNSSASPERDVDTRLGNFSVNKYEAGLDMQLPAPSVTTWGRATVDTSWRAGPETTGTNLGAVQGNANFNWGGSSNASKGTAQGSGRINSSTSAGHPSFWGSQQRYVESKDRDMEARNSSFGRGRNFWNRQSSYGGPNGIGSFRQMPKGQRVCKFYESGYCKKGASCSYRHP